MNKLIVLLLGVAIGVCAHADRKDIYVHSAPPNYLQGMTPILDADEMSKSFEQGRRIRKAIEARKARKKHEKAMAELEQLDLADNTAIMEFARKYPEEIESLKQMINLHHELGLGNSQ